VQQLQSSWHRVWRGIGGNGDGEALFSSLVARYSEPHRKYHSLQHLSECLAAFEQVRHLPSHPAEVEAALWFHDAIYEVKRNDNEELSAEWAEREFLEAGAPRAAAALVASLILATKHNALPTTLDAQVLVDIDLSILGAPETRFAEYEQQIREEYAFVPGFLFRRKRRAILRSFLDRPRIYSTPHFNASLEQAARKNLRRAVGANAT
jgi:predicted metal-dependent HD superfamily phosphohydrolase